MKKWNQIRTAAAAVLIVLMTSACVAQPSDIPANMQLASGDLTDYILYVPEDWTVDLSGGAVSAYASANDPTSVSVMAWGLPYSDTSIQDWWETYRSEFDLVFSEFTLISEENTLLDGVQAVTYTYTAKLGENTYRYTQTAAIHRNNIYLITITELADSETDHSEQIADILTDFRWK